MKNMHEKCHCNLNWKQCKWEQLLNVESSKALCDRDTEFSLKINLSGQNLIGSRVNSDGNTMLHKNILFEHIGVYGFNEIWQSNTIRCTGSITRSLFSFICCRFTWKMFENNRFEVYRSLLVKRKIAQYEHECAYKTHTHNQSGFHVGCSWTGRKWMKKKLKTYWHAAINR